MEPAYLAGFIDGEGTIGIMHIVRPDGFIRRRLTVQITNTNEQILRDIQANFGGTLTCYVPIHDEYKFRYDLVWRDYKCVPVLQQILPFLRIKKERAELALAYQQLKYGRGDNKKGGLDPLNKMVAGLLFCRMRKLNKKGRNG